MRHSSHEAGRPAPLKLMFSAGLPIAPYQATVSGSAHSREALPGLLQLTAEGVFSVDDGALPAGIIRTIARCRLTAFNHQQQFHN
jgi:hypothetical protein